MISSNGIIRIQMTAVRRYMEFFLCVVGMVMFIEGLPYFAFPDKMRKWVRVVLEMNDGSLRRFGFFLMFIGLMLVWLGKR